MTNQENLRESALEKNKTEKGEICEVLLTSQTLQILKKIEKKTLPEAK
jgi:hypothetical protein